MQHPLLLGLGLSLGLLGAGKLFLTRDQALQLAFGADARVTVATHWLTEEQARRAAELAGSAAVTGVVRAHAAADAAGKPLGTAYFDARTVRSHGQSLMVVIGPDGAVARLEVLSFDEPLEYLPKPKWHAEFVGRKLDGELQLKRGIHAVTGATLTARATVGAVREALALHQVLQPAPAPAPAPQP